MLGGKTVADKYCDLVMKGGITSGIVYPNAVLALAREYRFKSIGGTSAGAIAAAVAAAAACGDRRQQAGEQPPGDAGYGGLSAVSAQLSRRGFIYSSASGARARAYRLLVVLTGNARLPHKLLCLAVAVFEIAPLEVLVSLALLLGLGWWAVAGAAWPPRCCHHCCAPTVRVWPVPRCGSRGWRVATCWPVQRPQPRSTQAGADRVVA